MDTRDEQVKLDKGLIEAWNCLGHCYWEERELDYIAAGTLDPELPWKEQSDAVQGLVRRLNDLVASNGNLQPKQWSAVQTLLQRDAQAATVPPSHSRALLSSLRTGHNASVALVCRPLVMVQSAAAAAATHFVAVDMACNCFALAVLGMKPGAFTMNQLLTVLEPQLQLVETQWESQVCSIPLVKVADLNGVLADGLPLHQPYAAARLQTTLIAS